MTDNLKPDIDILDGAVHIPDAETIEMVYRLLDEEGIYIGASSALNVVAAVKVAEKLPEGTSWRKRIQVVDRWTKELALVYDRLDGGYHSV